MNNDLRIPRVKVQQAGRVSSALEGLAERYKRENPGKDCRWVYNPQSKPELSGVTGRMAEGYDLVKVKELGVGANFGMKDPEGSVQVADLVLMGIDEMAKRKLEMQRAGAAKDAALSIDRSYYEAIEAIEIRGSHQTHRSRPIGRSVIEERDLVYDVEQRTGGE